MDSKCPRCNAECPAVDYDSDFEGYVFECMYCANPWKWQGSLIEGKFVSNREPGRVNIRWVWHKGKKTIIG